MASHYLVWCVKFKYYYIASLKNNYSTRGGKAKGHLVLGRDPRSVFSLTSSRDDALPAGIARSEPRFPAAALSLEARPAPSPAGLLWALSLTGVSLEITQVHLCPLKAPPLCLCILHAVLISGFGPSPNQSLLSICFWPSHVACGILVPWPAIKPVPPAGEAWSLNHGAASTCVLSHFSHVWLFVTPRTVACQAPLSVEFSRPEYWRGLPCPSPGDLLHPEIKLVSPALAGGFSTAESPGKPQNVQTTVQLCSFHMLAKLCSKSFKLGFSSTRTKKFQMYRLSFSKAEESEIKLPILVVS